MIQREHLTRLHEAQIITEDQLVAIESFFWQESHEGEHAHVRPFIRFLVELGSALLLLGCALGTFFWMSPLPAWQGTIISVIAALLLGCFGIILRRTSMHDASPLLLLGASLLTPVVIFRFYDALTPLFMHFGLWLPLTQAGGMVVFVLGVLVLLIQILLFSTIKSNILSLPVALTWMALVWMMALTLQTNLPDLTYYIPAPNLALIVMMFGGMLLAIWGLLFNNSQRGSTGIWPELVGLTVTTTILATMTLNIGFLTAALPAQLMYLAATLLFAIAGMYIYARTQRIVWAFFSSLFLLLSVFTGWTAMNAGNTSGPLVLVGSGLSLLILAAVWQHAHRR